MSYQVLARKWRPREFSSLIGQQAVVTALTNALRDGKIAQAYLFSGIRGVGKTTAARLFAKALNCEKGPEVGPCNECATCRDITAGSDLDVLEIDAATYSKVEQVRELAESLKYGPTRDRYKVVVLDEVHRLSRQAFDALLKIVEEPPPRLVFIFATTEADAVPATILSRCQEFQFRRVGANEVAAHLAEICAAESIVASERALRLVARAGEGSVRDSVALLDQLATFGSGTVAEQEAARLVGGLDLALFGKLLAAIVAGDSVTVAALAREVEQQGWDPRQVHAHFLGYAKDALHLALAGDQAGALAVDLPAEEAASLAQLAREAGYENLLRLLHHLLASEATVRRSDAAQLALELAWLRAAELPKLLRVEELLAGSSSGSAPRAPSGAPSGRPSGAPSDTSSRSSSGTSSRASARTSSNTPSPPHPARPADSPAPASTPPRLTLVHEMLVHESPAAALSASPPTSAPTSAATSAATGTPASAAPAGPGGGIERFREELSARRPTLAARLAGARIELDGDQLSIALAGDDPLAAAQLARNSNRELIDSAAIAAFGAGTRWRLVEPAKEASSAAARDAAPVKSRGDRGASADRDEGRSVVEPSAAPLSERAALERDPNVQAVLDIFGGGVLQMADAGTASGTPSDTDPEEERE